MQTSNPQKPVREPQEQAMPGKESEMKPVPVFDNENKGSGKLENKIALITGGDSGIGKAVAVLFAKEGADIVIVYLSEHDDANDTKSVIEEKYGRKCLLIAADVSKEQECIRAIDEAVKQFNRIDVLVNNAATQTESKTLEEISTEQLLKTFETNIFSMFWLTKAALPHMAKGSAIINSTSVTAYRGSSTLIDYASTKGAIVAFTRSLSTNLIEKEIRVNAVAPGPIWTPLIAGSFEPEKVAKHGSDAPMKRAGEPVEVAPSYLFLACSDSSYITGQVLHPNGGEIING
jgi:NAD(P)-dependent dehydrogenase (short-subunit alcohol dehydrogenase family)